jgi:hypothetical protein
MLQITVSHSGHPRSLTVEWIQRRKQHALEFHPTGRKLIVLRWAAYTVILLMIYFFGEYSTEYEFIYFQF